MGKKVVIDTNTLVSAIGWKGNPHKVLDKVVNRETELIMSFEQFDELTRVLEYPHLKFNEDQKRAIKDLLLEIATFVRPKEKLMVVRDKSDDMILEAAVAGDAGYVITGDKDLHTLGRFRGIEIVTAKEFLEL